MNAKKLHRRFLLVMFASGLAIPAFAAGPDFSVLTGGIDFGTLIAALIAIYALFVPVGIVMKGGNAITRKLGFK